MKKILLTLVIFMSSFAVFSQNFSEYTNEKLHLYSTYLNDSIHLNFHLPFTHKFAAASTKYPITIIFDSQHERTYPHIINSIDLLTSESQMPENIIIGIPFNRYNRLYSTSNQKIKNDSLSGIERLEKFLFNELIPRIQKEYKGNAFITFVGHSRTAYLVNYLITKRSAQLNVAIALSGFYDGNALTTLGFKDYIKNAQNFPHKIRYYYTAGSSLEEESYLKECLDMNAFIIENKLQNHFEAHFTENKSANHMTNYWVSLPPIFCSTYTQYNAILNTWFHEKLKSNQIKNPIIEYENDLKNTSLQLGFSVNPSITQIFSLASSYGMEKKEYKTAIQFLEKGLDYFPGYHDFDLEIANYYQLANQPEKVSFYQKEYMKKVEARTDLTKEEKEKLLSFLD